MRLFLLISTLVISSCTTQHVIDINQYPDFDSQTITQSNLPEFKVGKIPDLTYCQADFSCASSSISTVLKRKFGIKISELEVMSGLLNNGEKDIIAERHGFSLLDMKLYVDNLGYQGNGFMLDRKDFIQIFKGSDQVTKFPIIIPLNYTGIRRFAVLSGGNTVYALIDDPAYGRYKIKHADFFGILDEEIIFTIKKSPVPAS